MLQNVPLLPAPPTLHGGDAEHLLLLLSQQPSPDSQVVATQSQRHSQIGPGRSSSVRKADWDPQFRREFEEYLRVDRVFLRQIWDEWNAGERRRAYLYIVKENIKEEMMVWKRREEAMGSRYSLVRVNRERTTLTLDRGVESSSDLKPNDPMKNEAWAGTR